MADAFKYSIIIPHFNIPDLLLRCLRSIPVREEIQVIVVDDCSPEGDHYLEKYPELSRPYLSYCQTPLGGSAGRARNLGLKYASGEWLIFMDADDLFAEEMFELLEEHTSPLYDLLFFNSKSVMSDDLSQMAERNFYAELFENYKTDHSELRFRYDFQSLWGKVFKRTLIEEQHIRFDETMYSNDVIFSFLAGHFATQVKIVDKILYTVTQRNGSLASSQFNEKKISLNECMTRLNVSLKCAQLTEKYNVPFKGRLHIDWSWALRQNYPVHYLHKMAQLLVTYPSMFLLFLKRDFKTIGNLIKRKG